MEMLDTNTFEFQTIIFAVQNDQNSQETNQQLLGSIQKFIDTLEKTKKQPKHYSLLTFNDKIVENVISTVDTKAFVDKFMEKLKNPLNSKVKKVRALYR
jgi:hypothetical protein